MNRNTRITEALAAIATQTGLDERYHADTLKTLGDVFDAGAASSATVTKSAPLSETEIEVVRSVLRLAGAPTSAEVARAKEEASDARDALARLEKLHADTTADLGAALRDLQTLQTVPAATPAPTADEFAKAKGETFKADPVA